MTTIPGPGAQASRLTDQDRLDWLRLTRTENVGPITFHRLMQKYGSARAVLDALPHFSSRAGRARPMIIPPRDAIEKELDRLRKIGGELLCAADPDYPLALAAVEDAPPVLACIGDTTLMQRGCVGIVGARNASLNGRKFAEILARDLGQAGQVIVSGLARGIDTAAHDGSLERGTIAVVAGGIDVVYPPENKALYARICAEGLIVAESPLGQEPFAQSFPRRNRIISGLSQAVVVVEASLRSGSLITARVAAEQGRDVFAVPGHPLDPRAEGTNALLRDGAIMARNAADILQDLGSFPATGLRDSAVSTFMAGDDFDLPANDLRDIGNLILDQLSSTPVHIDDLIRAVGVHTSGVSGTLLTLELDGQVQRLPGNRVVRINARTN